MRLENLGVIGNCQFAALVENTGSVVWCCLPRFDSEPVFGKLLDSKNGGQFLIGPADGGAGEQRYIDNTNILETTFNQGSSLFKVIDFAPRFVQYGRFFRPTMLVRIIEPIKGMSNIRVKCDPRIGWSNDVPVLINGSNHISFKGFTSHLRLTTDIPLSYLTGKPFKLTGRRHIVFTWGEPVEEPLQSLCERFLNDTSRYWQHWVKHCNIPPFYQTEVIRSALALKLHCYEDTGAIVASLTTSVPESPNSQRTWDYRYCWLRDAYYVLNAFRLLGHFEEREAFTSYLLNVAGSARDLKLSPLYRVDGEIDLDEAVLSQWPGFNGNGPVRIGNKAAYQNQNDIFGEMVLALFPIFIDERFSAERSRLTFELLVNLTKKAVSVAGIPDSGIWEYRDSLRPRTFSSLMSWAAADRMSRISIYSAPNLRRGFITAANKIKKEILKSSWNKVLGSFTGTYSCNDLDASILQMASLRFLPNNDNKLISSVNVINKSLLHNGWLYRYKFNDGFGKPTAAFVVCSFWLIEALVFIGKTEEAKLVLNHVLSTFPPLKILSEDFDPMHKQMCGNFPQAYSHVGLIHAAFSASPKWSELL
ncbi:MAG: glycoside hydrolase family 15 protein [Planctomycetes bacterium]|nr:glycoside hydrolase family 15 protein [Planctomycetota bacterium]